MICTARGIVLRTFKHTDNSVIAKVYTDQFGLQSLLIKVGKTARSKNKASMLQPLSCLELSIYFKEKNNLQSVREFTNHVVFTSIPFDTLKSSIALFMAEMMYRCIKEEEQNLDLYNFFISQIKQLDLTEDRLDVNNFHLKFLVNFSRYLGFYPGNNHFQSAVFDLSEGVFIQHGHINEYRLERELSEALQRVLESSAINAPAPKISAVERRLLLKALIDYYTLHLPGMGPVKSREVLETVLND